MFKQPKLFVVIGTIIDEDGNEKQVTETTGIEDINTALDIAKQDHDPDNGFTYIYQLEDKPLKVLGGEI